jgi:hypothetical protein
MPGARDAPPPRTEAATPEAEKLMQQALDLAKEAQTSTMALANVIQSHATAVSTNSMTAVGTASTRNDDMMKKVMENNQNLMLELVKGKAAKEPSAVNVEVRQLQQQLQMQMQMQMQMHHHAYYGAGYGFQQEPRNAMMFNQQFQAMLPPADPPVDVCTNCNTPRTTLYCGTCGQKGPT